MAGILDVLRCPLGGTRMEQPVRLNCKSEHTFDRKNIEPRLSEKVCPLCHTEATQVIANRELQAMVDILKSEESSLADRAQLISLKEICQLAQEIAGGVITDDLVQKIQFQTRLLTPPLLQNLAAFLVKEKLAIEFFLALGQLKSRLSAPAFATLASLKEYIHIPIEDNLMRTTLHEAVAAGDENQVRALVAKGSINQLDSKGKPPIFYAKTRNVLLMLLEAGAKPAEPSLEGPFNQYGELKKAIDEDDLVLIKEMLQEGRIGLFGKIELEVESKKIRGSIMQYLALKGRADIAKLFIAAGAKIGKPSQGVEVTQTPTEIAIEEGHLATVRVLFKAGANFKEAEEREGLFKHIVEKGDLNMLKFLEQEGVEFNRSKLIHIACEKNVLKMLNYFLLKEESIALDDLSSAIKNGHQLIVERLIPEFGDLNNMKIGRNEENTPLHIAVSADKVEIAELLWKAGANPDLPNKRGRTPRELAKEKGILNLF